MTCLLFPLSVKRICLGAQLILCFYLQLSPSALLGRSPIYRSRETACFIPASLGTHPEIRTPRRTKPLRNIEMICLSWGRRPGGAMIVPQTRLYPTLRGVSFPITTASVQSSPFPRPHFFPEASPHASVGIKLAWMKLGIIPVDYSILLANYPCHLPMDGLQISMYDPQPGESGMKGYTWASPVYFETSTSDKFI
ncbi:hypothetical protein ASPBRDRAFT_530125 [Aspergillus brasiliensis CBS 101740]|uniref:Uncharacterized protein n=1 Tax=Aspergillus brasiliensis (strain CBS 101740 / IMI 381727 / IBT 21946) TaxID=767769 RepID=A0A1L9UQX9_ASPBC|nr:hypothetical protein ASPBRDRAFT_530125 [Aspergillus brasiliensis CBS 101740]